MSPAPLASSQKGLAWYAEGRSSDLSLTSLQVDTGEKKKVMGVLDIYGFEILEVRERQQSQHRASRGLRTAGSREAVRQEAGLKREEGLGLS